MIEKLEEIEKKYASIQRRLEDPAVAQDYAAVRDAYKALSEFEPIVEKYRAFRKAKADLDGAREMAAALPPETSPAMAEGEASELETRWRASRRTCASSSFPAIRPTRATSFSRSVAGRAARRRPFAGPPPHVPALRREPGLEIEMIDLKRRTAGRGRPPRSSREKAPIRVSSTRAGAPRPARPQTEASGRIHTSAATVAVMPEAEDVGTSRCTRRTSCATGSAPRSRRTGRQHDVFRRAPHASSDRHRRAVPGRTLADQEQGQGAPGAEGPPPRSRAGEAAGHDRGGTQEDGRSGDRSEKIRRQLSPVPVTDHRIGLTSHRLQEILDGRPTS